MTGRICNKLCRFQLKFCRQTVFRFIQEIYAVFGDGIKETPYCGFAIDADSHNANN